MSQGFCCYRVALFLLTAAVVCPTVGLAAPGLERLPPVTDADEPSRLGGLPDEPSVRPIADAEPIDVNDASILPAAYLQSGGASSRNGFCWDLEGCVRGYYLNDQRVQWSGNEETFGAEAILAPRMWRDLGAWRTSAEASIYLNQPFDRNLLLNTPERQSYAANFEPPIFEIDELFVAASRDRLDLALGKFATPFGRTYFPLYTNARLDAPLIRTECILWRETGLRCRYRRELFTADVAMVNGSADRDTNSSKGVVMRLGFDGEHAALGFSGKVHDGVGSDIVKEYNNHVGVDAMVRRGRFTLSTEAIYDQYGYRYPGVVLDQITWGRSIYYREQNYAWGKPVTGWGYYVDLLCDLEPWCVSLNYGEYYPQQLGIPEHDVIQRRGILKGAYAVGQSLCFYLAGMFETEGYRAQANRPRRGWTLLCGMQWDL